VTEDYISNTINFVTYILAASLRTNLIMWQEIVLI